MSTLGNKNPTHTFRYAVEIQGVNVGWFTECGALTMEREVTPQPEGGVNAFVHQLPGRVTASRITLKRGLVDNALWDWFQQGARDGNVARQNISIILYNSLGAEVTRWDMPGAYPVKWTGPDFQSASSEIAIETLELVGGGGSQELVVQRAGDDEDAAPGSEGGEHSAPEIDLNGLAKSVYALFRQELRLDRERLGRKWP